jgi:hypothetical protein
VKFEVVITNQNSSKSLRKSLKFREKVARNRTEFLSDLGHGFDAKFKLEIRPKIESKTGSISGSKSGLLFDRN